MRTFLKGSCVFLLLLLAGTSNQLLLAQDQALKVIYPAGYKSNNLPFSPAVLAGGTLYVSGQGPADAAGNVPGDFQGQFRQALQNLRGVLQGAGMDYGNIVWLNVYLTDMGDLDAMNQVYWNTIGPNPPARTILQIAGLPGGEKVGVNCIAVADTHTRREIWPSGWHRGPAHRPSGNPGRRCSVHVSPGRDQSADREAALGFFRRSEASPRQRGRGPEGRRHELQERRVGQSLHGIGPQAIVWGVGQGLRQLF